MFYAGGRTATVTAPQLVDELAVKVPGFSVAAYNLRSAPPSLTPGVPPVLLLFRLV